MQFAISIFLGMALLLAATGCERSSRAPQSSADPETEKTYLELQRRAKIGAQWEAEADVVLETINVPEGSIRIIRSSSASGSNVVVQLTELDTALGQNTRSAAV